jgi:hypothetical protein
VIWHWKKKKKPPDRQDDSSQLPRAHSQQLNLGVYLSAAEMEVSSRLSMAKENMKKFEFWGRVEIVFCFLKGVVRGTLLFGNLEVALEKLREPMIFIFTSRDYVFNRLHTISSICGFEKNWISKWITRINMLEFYLKSLFSFISLTCHSFMPSQELLFLFLLIMHQLLFPQLGYLCL